MKQLIWKEWRELRIMPAIALLTYAAFLIAALLIHGLSSRSGIDYSTVTALGILTWSIFAVATSSGLIAQEIGSGTLQFLSMLPISRKRYWWVKVATAFLAIILMIVVTAIFWFIIGMVFYPGTFTNAASVFYQGSAITFAEFILYASLIVITTILVLFAAGLCTTPFFDRQITAIVAALIGGVVYLMLVIHGVQHFHGFHKMNAHPSTLLFRTVAYDIIWLMPLLVTSYQTFIRGESLKSQQRFIVGTLSFAASCSVAILIFGFGLVFKLW